MTTQHLLTTIYRTFKLLHSYISFALFIGVAIKCFHLVPLRSHINDKFQGPYHSLLEILTSAIHLLINQWYMYIFLKPSFESVFLLLNTGNSYNYKKFRNESILWILEVLFYLGTLVPYELSMFHKDDSMSTSCSFNFLIKSINLSWWFSTSSLAMHLFMIALLALLNHLPDYNVTLRINEFVADDKRSVSFGGEEKVNVEYKGSEVKKGNEFSESTKSTGWGICSGDERRLRINTNEFRDSCDHRSINVNINANSNANYIIDIYGYDSDMSESKDSSKSSGASD